MPRRKKTPRGRTPSQKRVLGWLQDLGQRRGYYVTARKKNNTKGSDLLSKQFYPDIVADPTKGSKNIRVFEIEATVSNNTVYKSLASLLSFLLKNSANAYLVVPDKKKLFAVGCLKNLKEIIKGYSKNNAGRYPKIQLDIVTSLRGCATNL